MAVAVRGNHQDQDIALFVLLLTHHGIYQNILKKLADLGHEVNYGMKDPGSLKEGRRMENRRGKEKQTWSIDIKTDKSSNEIE